MLNALSILFQVAFYFGLVGFLVVLFFQKPAQRRKILHDAYHYSGAKVIFQKFRSPRHASPKEEKSPTGFLWLIGLYVVLFGIASQRYENQIDIVENRANSIFMQLSTPAYKKALGRIPRVQQMKVPIKPMIWPPNLSSVESLLRDTLYMEMVVQLKETVEDWKDMLGGVDLSEADLAGTNLRAAHLNRAFLVHANLDSADLAFVDLEGANLSLADLKGANLWRANLKGANLHRARLENTKLNQDHLEGATLIGAYLNGAELSNAYLDSAILEIAHLEGANLRLAHLEGANLLEADLEGANLRGAHLKGANLFGVDLKGASLWRADLKGANLWRADLGGADLRAVRLDSALLEYASFRRANLFKAQMTGVYRDSTDFAWATWIDSTQCDSPSIDTCNRLPSSD